MSHSSSVTGLLERYAAQIEGTLGCFDRAVITGTLVEVAYSKAITARLAHEGVRCFDIKDFADPLRRQICEHAKALAAQAGLQSEHIRRKNFRKDERIEAILQGRGRHPGLVHVFSAMENGTTFEPWHERSTGRTGTSFSCAAVSLRPSPGGLPRSSRSNAASPCSRRCLHQPITVVQCTPTPSLMARQVHPLSRSLIAWQPRLRLLPQLSGSLRPSSFIS